MRSIKHIALGTFVTLSVFFAVVYSSCSKDACAGVTCLNGGSCKGGGVCSCPDPGTGGKNCEIVYRKLYFNNIYKGTLTYNIIGADSNNTLKFEPTADSPYSNIQIVWNNPGYTAVNLEAVITNSSAGGSNFTIDRQHFDTLFYQGSGTVNGATTTITLIKEVAATGKLTTLTFNSFNKQ